MGSQEKKPGEKNGLGAVGQVVGWGSREVQLGREQVAEPGEKRAEGPREEMWKGENGVRRMQREKRKCSRKGTKGSCISLAFADAPFYPSGGFVCISAWAGRRRRDGSSHLQAP